MNLGIHGSVWRFSGANSNLMYTDPCLPSPKNALVLVILFNWWLKANALSRL